MRFTLITERRRHPPRGRDGGGDGAAGPQPAERRARCRRSATASSRRATGCGSRPRAAAATAAPTAEAPAASGTRAIRLSAVRADRGRRRRRSPTRTRGGDGPGGRLRPRARRLDDALAGPARGLPRTPGTAAIAYDQRGAGLSAQARRARTRSSGWAEDLVGAARRARRSSGAPSSAIRWAAWSPSRRRCALGRALLGRWRSAAARSAAGPRRRGRSSRSGPRSRAPAGWTRSPRRSRPAALSERCRSESSPALAGLMRGADRRQRSEAYAESAAGDRPRRDAGLERLASRSSPSAAREDPVTPASAAEADRRRVPRRRDGAWSTAPRTGACSRLQTAREPLLLGFLDAGRNRLAPEAKLQRI